MARGTPHHLTRPPLARHFVDMPEEREFENKNLQALNKRLSALGRCPRCHLLLPHSDCLPESAADMPLHRGIDMDGGP